jgi:DnaK suppressor protein
MELHMGVPLPKPVQLREVKARLRHKTEGAHGICVNCGEAINPRRLAAIPRTSYCTICQKETELERAEPARWFDASTYMSA